MSNGVKIDAEMYDLDNFVSWFLWRCRRWQLRSTGTRTVVEHLVEEYNIDVASYDFDDESYKEFRGKGMFPND